MKTKIKCSKCNYEWETESKMIWVTCPSCRLKTEKELSEVLND